MMEKIDFNIEDNWDFEEEDIGYKIGDKIISHKTEYWDYTIDKWIKSSNIFHQDIILDIRLAKGLPCDRACAS